MPLIGYFCATLFAHAMCISNAAVAQVAVVDPWHRSVDVRTTAAIYHDYGRLWGLYVDDETPNQCAVVASDLRRGWHRVVLGVAPGAGGVRCSGAIWAQEWYPYGWKYYHGQPMPTARAYIVQYHFAWPGEPPPTLWQRRYLLRQAEAHNPRVVFRF